MVANGNTLLPIFVLFTTSPDLLTLGTFSLAITSTDRILRLTKIRDGMVSPGEIIDTAETLIELNKAALKEAENRQDRERVNDFLLDIRKAFWEPKAIHSLKTN
jgi:hypothetical protein